MSIEEKQKHGIMFVFVRWIVVVNYCMCEKSGIRTFVASEEAA